MRGNSASGPPRYEGSSEQVTDRETAASRFDALWAYYCRFLARAEAQGDPRLSLAPIALAPIEKT